MADGINTITDDATISGGETHPIPFRVVQPGTITVRSVPQPHPKHSETGKLGSVSLRRPGSNKPVALKQAELGEHFLGLQYSATAADAALAGDWACQVFNGTNDAATWHTTVSGFITNIPSVPLQTASFDIELLNLILNRVAAAAAVRVHLQSGDQDVMSRISWSAAISSFLGGAREYEFHVDDAAKAIHIPGTGDSFDAVFRINNLDSDPSYPLVIVGNDPATLSVVFRFLTDGARLVALDWWAPDIDLRLLEVSIHAALNEGALVPDSQANAILRFNSIDESSAVADAVRSKVATKLLGTPGIAEHLVPDSVRSNIDGFFARLLRLDKQVNIHGYRTDGRTLFVDYALPPEQPARPAPVAEQ